MLQFKAARALEAALVRQFGESARETVAEEVGSVLHGRSLFVKGDFDAIEKGVLEKVREKRQAGQASQAAQAGQPGCAVPLASASCSRPKSAAATQAAVPQATVPESKEASVVVSNSAPHLAMVPRPLLMKPRGCFDLWREFDSQEHAKEEAEKRLKKQAQAKKHLEALNEQVQQAKARREVEVLEKQRDKEAILAELRNNQSSAAAEVSKKLQKKQAEKEASLEQLVCSEKKKGVAVHRREVAKTAIDKTLQAEEEYRKHEFAQKQKHREDESKLMMEQYERSQALHQASKQKEKEEDLRLAMEWKRLAAKPQEAELPGGMLHKIRSNQERVDALVGSLGAALVAKQRAREAAQEELIEKHCREHEKKQLSNLFAQKDDRQRRTREMFADIKKQIDQKHLNKGVEDRAADLKQAEMWRENTEAYHREQEKKQEARRAARKELDATLFDAMKRKAGFHKSTFGDSEQDLLINRKLVEKMAKSSFKTHETVPILEKAMALKAKQPRSSKA